MLATSSAELTSVTAAMRFVNALPSTTATAKSTTDDFKMKSLQASCIVCIQRISKLFHPRCL